MVINSQSRFLISGNGETGSAWKQIFDENKIACEVSDPQKGINPSTIFFDVCLICFPCQDITQFVNALVRIEHNFVFKIMLIESTIIPFHLSCLKLNYNKILYLHSPIRGTHPNIAGGIKKYIKFVAPINPIQEEKCKEFARNFYPMLGIQYEILHCADETAFGKLINTTWYAMQIAFANLVYEICQTYNMNFEQTYTRFMESDEIGRKYSKTKKEDNIGVRKMADDLIPRPTMLPGAFGGHCLLPNIEILSNIHLVPELTKFTEWLLDMHNYAKNNQGLL
jgi:hypothetical protein